MLKLTSTTDPRLSRLPPEDRPAVERALANLAEICGREPDPHEDGFVGYVEADDDPGTVREATGRELSDLEGVFPDGPCLVGVLLWGNSGAGVTLVCPDRDGHAPEIVRAADRVSLLTDLWNQNLHTKQCVSE